MDGSRNIIINSNSVNNNTGVCGADSSLADINDYFRRLRR